MSQWIIFKADTTPAEEVIGYRLPSEITHSLLLGYSNTCTLRIRQQLSSKITEEHIFALTDELLATLNGLFEPAVDLCIQRWLEQHQAIQIHQPGCSAMTAEAYKHAAYSHHQHTQSEVQQRRPALAFISPLPPEQTGIANYNRQLLPLLAKHYDITLVVQQEHICPSVIRIPGIAQRMSAEQFRQHAHAFDRLVYHIGNSLFHAWQFDLLKQHPGLVVLHDYYLFDAIWWLENAGLVSHAVRRSLYEQHGYAALLAATASLSPRGPDHYPVNGDIVKEAAGLVVHSAHAHALHQRWYPETPSTEVHVLPLYRDMPTLNDDTTALRQQLGLSKQTLVITSFGGMNAKKGTDLLVEAYLACPFPAEMDVKLVLVGAENTDNFGIQLKKRINSHPKGRSIHITGYTDDAQYNAWIQVSDIAVQLRKDSRGESSGTLFDVMAYGKCAIVNRHGSSAEVPQHCVWQLEEQISISALSEAIHHLAKAPAERQSLGQQARQWVEQTLNPDQVTQLYQTAIESSVHHPLRQEYRWLDAFASALATAQLPNDKHHQLIRTLGPLNLLHRRTPNRILFDISTLAWNDQKTGIERVTRELAIQLMSNPPPGYAVELIQWRGDTYYTHPEYAASLLNIDATGLTSRPAEAIAGDLYLTVEWSPPIMEQAQTEMQRMRARGVRFYIAVHDLLPVLMPQFFPQGTDRSMHQWFSTLATLADGVLCVSHCVAEDVKRLLPQITDRPMPHIGVFNSGADFSRQNNSTLTSEEQQLVNQIKHAAKTKLLMVGTLEPRKGHQQVLQGFEQLWQNDEGIALIIVGKQGWDVEAFVQRLKQHPQRQQKLFWLQGCSDALLQAVYQLSDGLIAASYGEGFGLPLIEAAQNHLPILARDIPIFREVAQGYASFFQADTDSQVAEAIHQYAQHIQQGHVVATTPLRYNTWKQSAEQLIDQILRDPALNRRSYAQQTSESP